MFKQHSLHPKNYLKNKNKIKMKKLIITIIMLFCLIVNVKAQTITTTPFYGVTPSGRIFLIESHADALGSPGQTIEVSGDWNGKNTWSDWTTMALMKDANNVGVYVLDTGKKMKGTKTLCFRISQDIYFPSAAQSKPEFFININDMVSNGKDGFNLKIEVGSFDF